MSEIKSPDKQRDVPRPNERGIDNIKTIGNINKGDALKQSSDFYKSRFDTEKKSSGEQIRESDAKEVKKPITNKVEGLRREDVAQKELNKKYPGKEGYKILNEKYLLDKNGKPVEDPKTKEKRRIDIVVIKGNRVVDSVEVTSKTADKEKQTAKEKRIRAVGGNYIKGVNGELLKIPHNLKTRIDRRD